MLTVDDREVQAAVLAMRLAGRDLRRTINTATRQQFNGPWRQGIASRARTGLETRVLVPGARINAGNPPTFVAATSTRRLRGGFVPDTDGHAAEFGAADVAVTYGTRSPKGTAYRATRHTRRQLPRRRKKGPVMLTAEEMGHRAASLWVQIIVREYCQAVDEGR